MPTPKRAVIEVTGWSGPGAPVVRLDVDYRWWTSDPDPWKARTPGVIGAVRGTWEINERRDEAHLSGWAPGGFQRVLTVYGLSAWLPSIPFSRGDSGDCEHHITGFPMPETPLVVHWECLVVI